MDDLADEVLADVVKGTLKAVRFEVSNEGTGASAAVGYRLQVAETDFGWQAILVLDI